MSVTKSFSKRNESKSPKKKAQAIQPEDNWNLIANPSVYLDILPQPYRFINKCLDLMIMRPVFNKIT